jgi:hypothetical protein
MSATRAEDDFDYSNAQPTGEDINRLEEQIRGGMKIPCP